MTSTDGAVALTTCLTVGLGWWLWHWRIKEMEVERFRESMFGLRDEVFLLVAEGAIPVSDPAYRSLRLRLNGFIRFGHRMSLPWVLGVNHGLRKMSRDGELPKDLWGERMEELVREQPEVARRLQVVAERMNRAAAAHLVLMSPALAVLVSVPLIVVALVASLVTNVRRRLAVFGSRLDLLAETVGHTGQFPLPS